MERGWNLNVHYHRLVIHAASAHATTAIDVGCGEGQLAVDMAQLGHVVTAIDCHRPILAAARANLAPYPHATVLEADLLQPDCPGGDLAPGSFDLVALIAMLHHVDADRGLRALRRLVAPGGTLAIVGFAQTHTPLDYALAAAGRSLKACYRLRGRYHDHDAPMVWPPPLTMSSMKQLAKNELPGCTFRRLLSSRYAILWRAPEMLTKGTSEPGE